ncbi:3-carboxy-cis,cis-muconate cycloisomerase [Maribius pontilimi]|uniref:3-carboxy-cis,cis-muconate cycloisomerase n=1 Tax=Palleronia pontilimi TaxID=1964209 RepID=A0A934IGB5_9RHOB|nr:3-carboxy-cis,cis-muconate cycloisomerase [Palleronia pontilimi]MBJ3763867.1 3-carboxy-cis,cis-muconate cycloisomerase [Palleronia pontilimi]
MTDPLDHPWLAGLFGDDQAAAIWAPERHLQHMLAFEAAFTRAAGHVGRMDRDAAERTARAIERAQIAPEDLRDGTSRDGMPIPALVARLRDVAGGDVHRGATSQDVMDTAQALILREINALLDARLAEFVDALDTVSQRVGQHRLMGRTRMQAALPITAAHRIASWSRPLVTHRARLAALRPRVELVQLGGPVGDRADLAPHGDAMAVHMADALGLHTPDGTWHNVRDGLAEYDGLMSLISGSLGKMGQDIALMAQQGVDEITLGGGGGSSAMAHKRNPILAELLVTLARYNATQLPAMHHALVHEQERSGAAWALEWMILPTMTRVTARSLSAAITLVGQIEGMGTET